MKIVAEPRTFKNTVIYLIQVLDDSDNVIQERPADNITMRDEIIWKFAEEFNTTNIVIKDDESSTKRKRTRSKEATSIFRFSEIPSIPVLDLTDAQEFFDSHEDLVYNRIIVAVDEGLRAGLDNIKLFELAGTGVYVTSAKEDWKSGLSNALPHFESREEYEKCATCRDLLALLKKK